LVLPINEFPYILEIDACNEIWARVLMQNHEKREEVSSY